MIKTHWWNECDRRARLTFAFKCARIVAIFPFRWWRSSFFRFFSVFLFLFLFLCVVINMYSTTTSRYCLCHGCLVRYTSKYSIYSCLCIFELLPFLSHFIFVFSIFCCRSSAVSVSMCISIQAVLRMCMWLV